MTDISIAKISLTSSSQKDPLAVETKRTNVLVVGIFEQRKECL